MYLYQGQLFVAVMLVITCTHQSAVSSHPGLKGVLLVGADPAAQVYSIQAALASRQRAAHRCSSMRMPAGTAARALPPAEDGTATRSPAPTEKPTAVLETPHQNPAWERATLVALVAAQTAQQERLAEAARRRHAAAACAAAAGAQGAAHQGSGAGPWLHPGAGGRAYRAPAGAPDADTGGLCAEFDALVPWQMPVPGASQSRFVIEQVCSLASNPSAGTTLGRW